MTPPPYIAVEELAAVDGRVLVFGLFGVATAGLVGVIPNRSYTCLWMAIALPSFIAWSCALISKSLAFIFELVTFSLPNSSVISIW